MTRSTGMLCGMHLAGNGLLLLLGYYWLGTGESDAVHLLVSAALILFFWLAAIWLHSTALVFFHPENRSRFKFAAARSIRHILPLLLISIGVAIIYAALQYVYDSFGHEAFVIGSYSTLKLRRPVAPNNILIAFHWFIWILRWFAVPVFFLPLAAHVAERGWEGFDRKSLEKSKSILFWIETGLLLLVAVYLPFHLFFWIPKTSSFSMEVVSVTLRLGVGYLLFTSGLLAVEFVTSAGSPRVTQPSTVVSP